MSFWSKLTSWTQKSTNPDWGTLERYLSWAFGGGVASTGIVVNPQTAMQSAAVYSCVKVLSESIGMLPINIYQHSGKSLNLASEHPLQELLHNQPNEYQTIVEFIEMLVLCLCLRGNAYAWINRTRSGRVVELIPLHPDMVNVQMVGTSQIDYRITLPDGTFKHFGIGEIFHVRGQTMNGYLGLSPIAYARESIGLALATEKFGGQMFRNGARMGGVLEHPNKLSQEAYQRLKTSFDEATSGENAHKTALLEEGIKYSKVTMTADESQFLDTRKYQRSEIAAIFRVPPHMIGDLERATFSNIEQQSIDFVQYSLMPWLNRIEKAIRRDLFTSADKKSNIEVKFNIAALLRGDAAARAAYYNSGIMSGWLTRNEARTSESDVGIILNPIDGLDLPLVPMNMSDGTEDPDEDDEVQPPASKEPINEPA